MKTKTKCTALLLALLMIFLAACGPNESPGPDTAETPAADTTPGGEPTDPNQAVPDTPIQGGAILHAWSWSFNTIAENMRYIANAGFTAVQTSPISEHISHSQWSPEPEGNQLMGEGAWWFHYQPISFQIGNAHLGTEEEFAEMCRVAREHGVKVIVDVVPNHMSSDYDQIRDEVKNIEGGGLREPMMMGDTRLAQTQGQLLGLFDLNTHNPNVQQAVLDYLKRVIELGASGFRFDAVFHVELPSEEEEELRSDFWPVVLDNGAEFQYGEILGVAEAQRYVEYMPVTDATYGHDIVNAVRQGQFVAANLRGHRINAPAERIVTWVESHDTFCNYGDTADLTEQQILYGWAILAARDGSTPLFFSRPDGSAPWPGDPEPDTRWGNNVVGERGNDHFKSAEVTALNWFKRAMNGTEEYFSNPTGDTSLLMIERGSAGAVIINAGAEVTLDNVEAQLLRDFVYTDVLSGNEFTVADGRLSGTVPAESVVVFYEQGSPSVFLAPGGGDFFSDTLTLNLSAVNATTATYTIGDGEPVPFTGGDTIELGGDMQFDESVTVRLAGESGDIQIVREYTFTKREPVVAEGETVVFFTNTYGWDNIHCYVYVPVFGGVEENAPWPGLPMTPMGDGLYSYVLPEEFESDIHVMFNNGRGDEDIENMQQFPPPNAPGLVMERGEIMILEGGQLVPFGG